MTKYHKLNINKKNRPKRVGRGISAGGGKTAGRGTKGQGARKSGGVRVGFEGGQMPLHMRLPKLRGFKSGRPKTAQVYLSDLESIKQSTIDNHTLADEGVIKSAYTNVKIVGTGQLKRKVTVKTQLATQSAVQAIEKAGGSFNKVSKPKRSKKKSK